jgi:hypothetical protein
MPTLGIETELLAWSDPMPRRPFKLLYVAVPFGFFIEKRLF